MALKLDDFEKTFIEETATLSGYPVNTVREVLEFLYLRQIEQLMNDDPVTLPFIGKMTIEIKGDAFEAGQRVSEFKCHVAPSSLFVRIVGDVQDGESLIIADLLEKKIKASCQQVLDN